MEERNIVDTVGSRCRQSCPKELGPLKEERVGSSEGGEKDYLLTFLRLQNKCCWMGCRGNRKVGPWHALQGGKGLV